MPTRREWVDADNTDNLPDILCISHEILNWHKKLSKAISELSASPHNYFFSFENGPVVMLRW